MVNLNDINDGDRVNGNDDSSENGGDGFIRGLFWIPNQSTASWLPIIARVIVTVSLLRRPLFILVEIATLYVIFPRRVL